MSLEQRLHGIRERLERATTAADRAPGSARLIAVSKTHPAASLIEVREAGQVDFGESYAQELRDKAPVVSGVRWHFIGRLQRNKVKYVAPHAYRVHGVTHVSQAEALAARANRSLDVLVNVELAGEASKVGLPKRELGDTLDQIARVDGIRLVGLMCIPPFTEQPADAAPFFAELSELARRHRDRGHPLDELSMGMSRDFEHAVKHGATWIRVGTAIFGPRTPVRDQKAKFTETVSPPSN